MLAEGAGVDRDFVYHAQFKASQFGVMLFGLLIYLLEQGKQIFLFLLRLYFPHVLEEPQELFSYWTKGNKYPEDRNPLRGNGCRGR